MTKEYILNFLTTHKKEMQETYALKKIGLFGSYANNTATNTSDIDIMVDMPSSFDTFFDLKDFLELNLKKPIDLGLEKSMRPFIKNSIKDDIIYV
ncbi:MAG: nucleotidyltransferase domain-containing protein [Campylobacterota bacterium]|nr:nucleotidyltransferase domain-containing protein [Campylobacterota bacterium]